MLFLLVKILKSKSPQGLVVINCDQPPSIVNPLHQGIRHQIHKDSSLFNIVFQIGKLSLLESNHYIPPYSYRGRKPLDIWENSVPDIPKSTLWERNLAWDGMS